MILNWYPYPSNFSGGEVNGIATFLQYGNEATNGILGFGIVILIFLMTFGFSLGAGSRKAILTSSFITFCLSIYLYIAELIPIYVPIFLIIMVVVGAIFGKDDNSL